MLLLAFDTATPAITVALHDGSDVVAVAGGEGTMAHGELLAPAIRSVLDEAGAAARDLTDVAVGVGPGPFTGLRVGVVTALTMGSTLGITTHGVCTLDILAAEIAQAAGAPGGGAGPWAANEHREVVVATDARRKEVYWAHHRVEGGRAERLDGPHVTYPADLAELHPDLPVFGRGATLYPDALSATDGPLDPSASALARAVVENAVEELPLEPLYLRRPDATPASGVKQA
ncbi:tRNA (adenosine(37)-N6)-threonylcarbamoyltransferase complex dimerization subunit type 1 TsaB [Aeromicrobium terrae]|uniref:tRNA (Adenosine(37)-N6)-threonylcarbamoyltransferase complex dimerization subunit type 1 TsaB n=1 Tax=Aeromicrobium terrae TaxID=2498846 RepID=A0A5C8NJ37_9ACTN|nr:tRNA (adenosine(37)-N6)-threonylcarbamoyltransferase complex dimerization subunit type 1 TsaB [Aeromicrobium terrae]TXL58096.1 tRNA (adenosine(37)-N6)-threonylcarbamoyltransferase complex dimerization subunit type 1 TsaB [Aeromicrobium terrae]